MTTTDAEFQIVDTPDGPFGIISTDDAVLASGWTADPQELRALIHPSLRPAQLHQRGQAQGASGGGVAAQAADAVRDYYAGRVLPAAQIPVRQQSGEFRMRAWDVMRDITAGQPVSYAEFARRTGNQKAIRAAAGACAFNAAALFVPCHRVLRSDGSLGGFRYGAALKRILLDRERDTV